MTSDADNMAIMTDTVSTIDMREYKYVNKDWFKAVRMMLWYIN